VINRIMENGFMGLAAYVYVLALASLVLFAAAGVANAFLKQGRFDLAEFRKLFLINLSFTLIFALLDYFLV